MDRYLGLFLVLTDKIAVFGIKTVSLKGYVVIDELGCEEARVRALWICSGRLFL